MESKRRRSFMDERGSTMSPDERAAIREWFVRCETPRGAIPAAHCRCIVCGAVMVQWQGPNRLRHVRRHVSRDRISPRFQHAKTLRECFVAGDDAGPRGAHE